MRPSKVYQSWRVRALGVWISVIGGLMAGCGNGPAEEAPRERVLCLATTTSTQQSGLLDILLPIFEARHSLRVKVTPAGSGEAIRLAREGEADVVLVHSRKLEDQFVAEGHGLNRRDVMYNDFVLLGPPDDPANIRGQSNTVESLAAIAKEQASFVTRGDNSGTHARELELWKLVGVEPEGDWYHSSGTSMLSALKSASQRKAYTLSDRGTFLFNETELDLVVMHEGDERLFNPYGVIAVNPARHPNVNYEGAMQFIEFITSSEGQELIQGHGRVRFSRPLFQPMAIQDSGL